MSECWCSAERKENLNRERAQREHLPPYDWSEYGLHHGPAGLCPLGVNDTWHARALNAEAKLAALEAKP